MDTTTILHELEAAIGDQLALTGNPDVGAAGEILLSVLEPTFRRSLMRFAEQAVTEVQAQLPEHEVSLTMRDGQPEITIREAERRDSAGPSMEDLQARLTLRLPEFLKAELEAAAGSAGDSINSYVIKSLAGRKRGRTGPRQVHETFET